MSKPHPDFDYQGATVDITLPAELISLKHMSRNKENDMSVRMNQTLDDSKI